LEEQREKVVPLPRRLFWKMKNRDDSGQIQEIHEGRISDVIEVSFFYFQLL
jgi:hypothetical protein